VFSAFPLPVFNCQKFLKMAKLNNNSYFNNMKKLVIFYSLNNNTKFIAEKLAQGIGADILELKPEKEIPQKEPMQHLSGGKQAMAKETPRLQKYDINLADYDTLIIGTPVWAFTFTPPLRTFLRENQIKNKKIILFCTYDLLKGMTFNNLRKELEGNDIVAEIGFRSVLKKQEENLKKLQDFIKESNFC